MRLPPNAGEFLLKQNFKNDLNKLFKKINLLKALNCLYFQSNL